QEFDNIITVGASNEFDRANYSSYGAGLDILTEGGTRDNPVLSTVKDGVGMMAGTSVAAARATGVASLVWAANSDLSYRQVIDILELTAVDVKTPGWDAETGAGLLNAVAAIELAKKTTPQDYTPTPWATPLTWGGEGLVTPVERAVSGGNSLATAAVQPSPNFTDNDRVDVNNREKYYKITIDQPGYLSYTLTRTNGTEWLPSIELLRTDGKPISHQFSSSYSKLSYVGAGAANGGGDSSSTPVSITNKMFVDPGTYYFKANLVDSSYVETNPIDPPTLQYTTAQNYNLSTQFILDQPANFSGAAQFRTPSGVTAAQLNTSDQLNYNPTNATQQKVSYSLDVNEPGNLSLKIDSSVADRIVLQVKKLVGIEGENGAGEVLLDTKSVALDLSQPIELKNLNKGRYLVEVLPRPSWDSLNGTWIKQPYTQPFTINGVFSPITAQTEQLPTVPSISQPSEQNIGILNGIKTLNSFVGNTKSYDNYTFTISEPSTFKLKLDGLNANVRVELLDKNSTLFNASVPNEASYNYSLMPGTYAVKVQPASAEDQTQYRLSLSANSLVRDLGVLPNTKTVSESLNDNAPWHFYRFQLNNNSIFHTTLNNGSEFNQVDLLDTNYNLMGVINNPKTLNSGTYYARVNSFIGASNSYNLNLQATPTNRFDNAGNNIWQARDIGTLIGTQTFTDFIDSTDLTDFYRFTINDNSSFNFNLSAPDRDASVTLYNSDGSWADSAIKYSIPAGGINKNLKAGTYYVQIVGGISPDFNYNLSLSAATLAPSDNAGNSLNFARNIGTLNGTQTFNDSIGDIDTNDYYRFDLKERSNLRLQLDGLNAGVNWELGVIDSSTNTPTRLNVSNDYRLNTLDYTSQSLAPGNYYFRINPTAAGNNTNYNLSLTGTPSNNPPKDLNIKLEQTYTSNKNVRITGRVYDPDGASDIDKVLFQLGEQHYYITNFTPSSQDNRWAEFTYDLGRLSPGQYGYSYVAYDKSGSRSGTTISLSKIDVVYSPEDYAGDTPNQARDIGTLSGTHTFSDFVGTTDTEDYYRFTVPETNNFTGRTNVKIRLDGLSSNAGVSLYRLNSDGTKSFVNSSPQTGTTPEVINTDLAAGTYLVEVFPTDGSVNTNYNLSLSVPSVGSINSNQTVSGTLDSTDPEDSLRYPGRFYEDYRLTGFTPGQKVKLTLNASGFNPYLLLLNSETEGWMARSSVNTANSAELEFTVPSDWNNTVRVTSLDTNGTGSYTLSATPVASIPANISGDDKYPTINLGKLSDSQTLNGSVGGSGPVNVEYRFDVDATSGFNLKLDGLSADANVDLRRFNGNDGTTNSYSLIDGSYNGGTSSEIINQKLEPGTYAVRIYPSETGNSTNYNLVLSSTAPTSVNINGYEINGNFYPVFWNYRATLGNPTENSQYYSSNVSYQRFKDGSIISSPKGTFVLYGDIAQKYFQTGGLSGKLGAPTSDPIDRGNGTLQQYFENGYIFWNGQTANVYQTGSGSVLEVHETVNNQPQIKAQILNELTIIDGVSYYKGQPIKITYPKELYRTGGGDDFSQTSSVPIYPKNFIGPIPANSLRAEIFNYNGNDYLIVVPENINNRAKTDWLIEGLQKNDLLRQFSDITYGEATSLPDNKTVVLFSDSGVTFFDKTKLDASWIRNNMQLAGVHSYRDALNQGVLHKTEIHHLSPEAFLEYLSAGTSIYSSLSYTKTFADAVLQSSPMVSLEELRQMKKQAKQEWNTIKGKYPKLWQEFGAYNYILDSYNKDEKDLILSMLSYLDEHEKALKFIEVVENVSASSSVSVVESETKVKYLEKLFALSESYAKVQKEDPRKRKEVAQQEFIKLTIKLVSNDAGDIYSLATANDKQKEAITFAMTKSASATGAYVGAALGGPGGAVVGSFAGDLAARYAAPMVNDAVNDAKKAIEVTGQEIKESSFVTLKPSGRFNVIDWLFNPDYAFWNPNRKPFVG
ncbi:MAG TPA: hypothetical protein DD990_25895, partial [Cyanobacteria bacterium UBA11368]|nr:hypothetical protein [Cyanobacteria bacterium UBA11368]